MNSLAYQEEPEIKTIPMMPFEHRKEAERFGRSEAIFEEIEEDYTKLGLIGEEHNKILSYIAAVSRKMDIPLNILVLSSSGAGKSALQDKTLRLTPEEDVIRTSSITDKAIFYMEKDALKNKVLAIEEAAGVKDMYAIRTLITEGHLTIETVSGCKLRKNTVEGPVSVFQTTTNPDINPETKSRFFILGVDESRTQTQKILSSQRKAHTLAGIIQKASHENILTKHHCFQRLLRNYAVVNPYAESLFYGDDRLQARRDQPKFLNLCCAVAFLNQMKKEVKYHGELEYIEVDIDDIEMATELASEILGMSLDDLSLPARDLLMQLDEMLPKNKARFDRTFTRREVMEHTGWAKTRLHIHLQELLDYELVVKTGKRNCVEQYKLIYNGEGKSGKKFLIGLSK